MATTNEVKVPFAGAPLHKTIVPEKDIHHFGPSHSKHVQLIATPLASEDDIAHGHDLNHHAPHIFMEGGDDEDDDSETSSLAKESHYNEGDPILKRPHEAPTIQLFFDLYFVANLTTFSGQHEIHGWDALRSYIGYFAMIWFTWFQNTLCDVRFSNDSVLERCFKAAQFGIMTGFAITGPGYQTGFAPGSQDAELALSAFKTLSLILMTSRLILCLQYGVALFWVRSFKGAALPVILHICVLFCSAMIYLGLYFGFNQNGTETVLAGWYVTFVIEAWLIMIISGRPSNKWMSFRNTILVERLGLLTLIILGEGIISMSVALNNSSAGNYYNAPIIAQIICIVCVSYTVYMLYFDNVQPERMGAFRQHVWAILHFPFHISIVLIEEAMAQFAIWTKLVQFTQPLLNAVNGVDPSTPTLSQVNTLWGQWNSTVAQFGLTGNGTTIATFVKTPELSSDFNFLINATKSATTSLGNSTDIPTTVPDALNNIYQAAVQYCAGKFRIDTDEPDVTGYSYSDQVFQQFEVVYIYFFCFAGLVLINLAILFLLGKRRKLRGELLGAGLRATAGVTLICLAAMAHNGIPDQNVGDQLHNYMTSGVVLPTVLLVYLLVLVVDNILVRYVKSVVHWRLHLHHHGSHMPAVEQSDYMAREVPQSPQVVRSTPASPTGERPQSPIVPKSPVAATSAEVTSEK